METDLKNSTKIVYDPIDKFYQMMIEICDGLPDAFFKGLNLGVRLSEEKKTSPYGVIMGQYQHSIIGNGIVIYYGSFEHIPEEHLKAKLEEVIKHEFRHHMENLAGMHGRDSLEYEDKQQIERAKYDIYLRNTKNR